jgi:hypothetical protein
MSRFNVQLKIWENYLTWRNNDGIMKYNGAAQVVNIRIYTWPWERPRLFEDCAVGERWGCPIRKNQEYWSLTMILKSTIPVLVACFALGGGAAMAGDGSGSTAGAMGVGGATASPAGAAAGGMSAGRATTGAEHRAARDERRRMHKRPAAANSATTYGSGAVSTTRSGANAGVTSGGAASGSGVQSTGSTVDAYGETTRDGSNADIYGDSTATSGAKP